MYTCEMQKGALHAQDFFHTLFLDTVSRIFYHAAQENEARCDGLSLLVGRQYSSSREIR